MELEPESENITIIFALIKEGYIIVIKNIHPKIKDFFVKFCLATKKHFTITHKSVIPGRRTLITQIKNYDQVGTDYLIVPRMFPLFVHKYINDFKQNNIKINWINKIPDPNEIETFVNPLFVLNHNQQIIFNHLFDKIFTKEREDLGLTGCIIKLNTGLGKSYLAIGIINQISKPTLIIVPTIKIATQWVDLLKQMFTNLKIGAIHTKSKTDGDIIVMVSKSAIVLKEFKLKSEDEMTEKKGKSKDEIVLYSTKDFYAKFGLVIFDEVHNYTGPAERQMFSFIPSKYILGLSATPQNAYDVNIITQRIGPIISCEDLPDFIKSDTVFKGRVKIIRYEGDKEYTKSVLNKVGMRSCQLTCGLIAQDTKKNELILQEALDLSTRHKGIFILTARRSHVTILYELFKNYKKEEIKVGELSSNQNEESLELDSVGFMMSRSSSINAEECQIIISTVDFCKEGISIPRFTALIVGSAIKKKFTQCFGRIIRLDQEFLHVEREIVDIVDNKSFLKSHYYERSKVYIENKFRIWL